MENNNFKANHLGHFQEHVQVTLQNKELWSKFHELETEMIVTKSGRRMFPSLRVHAKGLDPSERYCILLEFAPASSCRLKYSSSGGWAAAGTEEIQSSRRVYLHPDSPAPGAHWMNQPISFSRVKLTNTQAPPSGHVVLSSMHKYQPRILIVRASDPRIAPWAPSLAVVFPETEFVAVTAYQNEKITQLKIDNNPFAKGFRENGQSRCKRKEVCENAKDQNKLKQQKDEKNDSSPPPPPPPATSYQLLYSVMPYSSGHFEYPPQQYFTPLQPGVFHQSHHVPFYPQSPNYNWLPNNYQHCPQRAAEPVQRSDKFTDFSIRAICGIS